MTIRSAHRRLVDAVARRTGLTGQPLPNRPWRNRPLRLADPGRRLGVRSRRFAVARHDPSRRRFLVRWQARVEAWLPAWLGGTGR